MMHSLLQDLRRAVRSLVKSPAFTVAALAALALGMGVTTAVFSVVDSVIIRNLAFDEPDRLISLHATHPRQGQQLPLSYPDFRDFREQVPALAGAAFAAGEVFTLRDVEEPRQVLAAEVSDGFFQVLGVRPRLGRGFLAEEEEAGLPVVVLSHSLWSRVFGGEPSIVGRPLTLDSVTYTVVGVMPPGVVFPAWAELWIPMGPSPTTAAYARRDFRLDSAALGRLAPEVSAELARTQLDAVAARIEAAHPENEGWRVRTAPLRDQVVGDVSRSLFLLLAAAGLVLLIACANVANLMIARMTARSREFAVRAALGAGRGRIVRQVLVESVVLALCGAAIGALLARWGVGAFVAAGANLPRLDEVGVDLRVLAVTALVALATAVLFGLAPALRASRAAASGGSLNSGARGAGAGIPGRRLRGALLVGQVAITVVLLVGAALLVRSFERLRSVDPGFRTDELLTYRLYPPTAEPLSREVLLSLYDDVAEAVRRVPGVTAVEYTNHLPLTRLLVASPVEAPGHEPSGDGEPMAAYRVVTPEFLRTLGVPLRAGRHLQQSDMTTDAAVALVNGSFAREFLGGEAAAVGRFVTVYRQVSAWETFRSPVTVEVVGVVGDVPFRVLSAEPVPEVFLPFTADVWTSAYLGIRTAGDPLALKPAVQRAILGAAPMLPVDAVQSMDEVLHVGVADRRLTTRLATAFSLAALLLAVVGIYGVTSYLVSQRTPEIGVRMALGARTPHVLRLVLRGTLLLAVAGSAIGIAGALVLTRFLEGMLFGVGATDPLVFVGIPVLILATAALAGLLPSRRATRVDPMVALRAE